MLVLIWGGTDKQNQGWVTLKKANCHLRNRKVVYIWVRTSCIKRLMAYDVWLLIPLINRAMFPRLSAQMTRLWEGSVASRRVIMLSQSSCSRFLMKSTSPVYSEINVMSFIGPSASTVYLLQKRISSILVQIAILIKKRLTCKYKTKKQLPFTGIENDNQRRALASCVHSSAKFEGFCIFLGKNLTEKPHMV